MLKAFGILMLASPLGIAGFMTLACMSAVVLPATLVGGIVLLLTRTAKGSHTV